MVNVIMKSSFLILKEKKLVIDMYEGVLTLDTFKGHKLKQVNHPDFTADYNLLSDFTNIEVRMSIDEVSEYAEFIKKHIKQIVGSRKAAVVLKSPNQFLYAKKYDSSVKEETGQQMFTFMSFDEGLKWLGLLGDKEEIMNLIKKYRENPMFEWKVEAEDNYM